jgi:hypothetical protein
MPRREGEVFRLGTAIFSNSGNSSGDRRPRARPDRPRLFYVWDYGVKNGDIRQLGVAAYAAPVLSTLILVEAGFAPPRSRSPSPAR